ncbi:MAG: site-2 protease family protein [Candidatus Theseobacter exili]|nr:site-2 protease family protein [Candidatus Theseobacter exili]
MNTMLMLFVLLFSVIIHECSHGYMALIKGDTTARDAGRLTLNPLPHIDPVGSILLPLVMVFLNTGFIFGWAKPVPIDPYNLANPKKDMMWIGAAGPLSNLAVGAICALLLRLFINISINSNIQMPHSIFYVLYYGCMINFILAIFNMFPIPPLDGSRILMGLLPPKQARIYMRLEPYGMLILMGVILLGLLRPILMPILNGLITLFLGKQIALYLNIL